MRTKALIVGLVAAFMWHAVTVSGAQAADQTVNIACGTDVAATINADSGSTATRFVLGSCDFTASQMIIPRDGDEIVCATPPTFTQRGPAYDPNTSCTVTGAQGVENVFRPIGQGGSIATVRFEGIRIVGGTGTPGKAGSGTGIAGGTMGDQSVLYGVEITGSDAVGMSGGHGLFDRSEVFDTTNNPDFLSFTAAGIKAIDEMHIRNSYIHDNQGNGLWCDEFCEDAQPLLGNDKYWVHDNLVVNNGRAGIRFERVGDVSTAGEALIENNEVHGNSPDAVRGGISVRDAQNAIIQNNRFGAVTIAGVAYPPNSSKVAIIASDSGRADRPDLFNIDIVNNILNGETIKGCELPDTVVECSEAQPPPSTDTTPPQTSITSGPAEGSSTTSTSATFAFTSNEQGSTFKCQLSKDGTVAQAWAACTSQKAYPNLTPGSYKFEVQATDPAGNVDPTPEGRNWTITSSSGNTTPPRVISTVPTANATGVAPTANVMATFSEDMLASTINTTTFKLFKKGSTTQLVAAVSYDASTDTATLNPNRNLTSGVTYKAVVTTGAKDSAGSVLDQNPTTGSQQMAWFFTVSN